MPDDSVHINLALHNLDTVKYLLDEPEFSDWAAVVVSYAALHIIDAVLFCDPKAPIKHGVTHSDRRDILRGTTHYNNIYRHYSILSRASNIACYLEDRDTGNVILFSIYMPSDKVRDTLIKNHFWQIIKSSANFLAPKHTEKLKCRFNSYFSSAEQ
jgi:hypothetical protein